MSRKLTDTEIALVRFGIWPCCGEKNSTAVESDAMMRTSKCVNCGTIIRSPLFVTTTEMMKRLSVMIHQPEPHYDAEATALRVGLTGAQVDRANLIMNLAPHEARQQRRKLWWLTIPPEIKWTVAWMSLILVLTMLVFENVPGTPFDQFRWAVRVLGVGVVVLFVGMAYLSWKRR